MTDGFKTIQSVERAMALLEHIAVSGDKARLVDLSEQLQLHKSTVSGLLKTLLHLGYIERQGRFYILGLRLHNIAQPLLSRYLSISLQYRSLLETMAEECGETCYLAVPCGTSEYLYIDTIESHSILRVVSPRGLRENLTTSAIGKVFLAFDIDLLRQLRRSNKVSTVLEAELENIRQLGYALDLEQAEVGLNCLAIPLFQKGKIYAALGVAGSSLRLNKDKIEEVVKTIIK